jgi:thioredoxin-related protein
MQSTKYIMLLILAWGGSLPLLAQNKVKWLTWEQAIAKAQNDKKKIVVDVYTEWCGWCKKMDKTTFADDEIATYMNQHYYSIKFDAEYREDIILNGKKYSFVKNGEKGYHQLAAEILQGRMSYPSTVFLDENFAIIQAIPGYQDGSTFAMIITYFASNSHKSMPWPRYTQQFERAQMTNPACVKKGRP